MPSITFTDEDFSGIDPDLDDPMVITMKTLVDRRSLVDFLFMKTFKKMGLSPDVVIPYDEYIVDFSGERVDTRGYVDLYTKFGDDVRQKTIKIRCLIVDVDTSYNVLLGRSSLNGLGAILAKDGGIARLRVHHKTARECYATTLRILPRYVLQKKEVNSITKNEKFDPRPNDKLRVEPKGETTPLWIGKSEQNKRILKGKINKESQRY